MGKTRLAKASLLASSLFVCSVALSMAGGVRVGPVQSIKLNENEPFSGRIVGAKSCRAKRVIKLIDEVTGRPVAKTKTNRKGKFSGDPTFSGRAHAETKKKTVLTPDGTEKLCASARSPVKAVGQADLVVGTNDPIPASGPTVSFSVANLGPSTAHSAVFKLTSNRSLVAASAGCSISGSEATCLLGSMSTAPSDTRSFTFRTQCAPGLPGPATWTVTGSASSATPDPVSTNHAFQISMSCP